jgi:SH3-like domain-containing protein
MKSARVLMFSAVLLCVAASDASALEFKSVGAEPAVLYDAPSTRGRKVFVAPRGMPVEVVLNYGDWTKVRDASGDLAWVEAKQLTARRNVVVRVPNVRVHASPEDSSQVVFTADKGVLLELVEPSGEWLKVRHRDGQSGYVKASEVWGE